MSITIPTTGLEYTIIPDGNVLGVLYPGSDVPFTWSGVNVSYDSSTVLNGYTIQVRYRVVTLVPPVEPETEPSYFITYPPFNITSQTLTCVSHGDGNPMETNDGNEFFAAAPGTYGIAVAGITNGKKYDYFKVFDQTIIEYYEREGEYDATVVEGRVPTTPYDPNSDPVVYPIDAITAFVPDPREQVTVYYSLTTVYDGGSETVSIQQTCTQDIDNWTSVIKQMIERSYFTHDIHAWMEPSDLPEEPIEPSQPTAPQYE